MREHKKECVRVGKTSPESSRRYFHGLLESVEKINLVGMRSHSILNATCGNSYQSCQVHKP
jgi:hypothetical protein